MACTVESFKYSLRSPDAGLFWCHPRVREGLAKELGLHGGIRPGNYVLVTAAAP